MRANSKLVLVLSLLAAAGVWLYVQRVLVPYQVIDAAIHGRPRGDLSDLYPQWLAARELLLHGRDPYGIEVTREIQTGYYGRPVDPAHPADPKDLQKFAYPVYVTFLLAPTIHQPYSFVRQEAFYFLLILTIASALLWLRMHRCEQPCLVQCAIAILTIGSLPVVQGLKLQQMTLLVSPLIAIAVWLLTSKRPILAGIALALTTIKPQLAGILLLWLALWTLADWRRRFRWVVSFMATLVVFFMASEHYLPHWLPRFLNAVRDYRTYNDAVPIFTRLLASPADSVLLVSVVAATGYAAWKHRAHAAHTPEFAGMAALMLAVTLTLIPTYALYNQVLLLPALLWLARECRVLWQGGSVRRILLLLVALFLSWPWASAAVLAAASFILPPDTVQKAWAVPFWTALLLPVGVAALMLVAHFSAPFPARKLAGAS